MEGIEVDADDVKSFRTCVDKENKSRRLSKLPTVKLALRRQRTGTRHDQQKRSFFLCHKGRKWQPFGRTTQ